MRKIPGEIMVSMARMSPGDDRESDDEGGENGSRAE